MKKFNSTMMKSFLLLAFGMWFGTNLNAQSVYDQTAPYDTMTAVGDTLHFHFTGIPTGAWGNATVRIYFEGDDGDAGEYLTAYGEGNTLIGTIGPNLNGGACTPQDSIDRYFAAIPNIVNWNSNGSIDIVLVPSALVEQFCVNRAKVRLMFNYCTFGVPLGHANISLADSTFCPLDAAVIVPALPAGGTFSGTGVTGNTFNPAGLSSGYYYVVYDYTDSIGCTSADSVQIYIDRTPNVSDTYACPGYTAQITPNGGSNFIWFADAGLSTRLDTATTFTTPALYQTTNYWVASDYHNGSFSMDTILASNYDIVDHDNITGDDRGGIAVTDEYVFINGDGGIARYDLDLNNPSGTLPQRDGLFCDLRTPHLWTLWSTNCNCEPGGDQPQNLQGGLDFPCDAIRALDNDMEIGSEMILLSQTINVGDNDNQAGMFSGYGVMGIFNGNDDHFYVIDLDDGYVNDLGQVDVPNFEGSENWADWGVLEGDCSENYSILYKDNDYDDIYRQDLSTGNVSPVTSFPSDLSDMASFTYNPWNNRWYFHFEGGSGMFGGSSETLGYADATNSSSDCGGGHLGCPSMVTVTVNTVDIGPDTTICDGQQVSYASGLDWNYIEWNGNSSGLTVYTTGSAGEVTFYGEDYNGCSVYDTAMVSVNASPVSDFTYSANLLVVAFTQAASGGTTPYSYDWDFGDGGSSTTANPSHTYSTDGAYMVCLTVTDSNNCGSNVYCETIDVTTGVIEAWGGSLNLFPNPTTGQTILDVTLDHTSSLGIRILNLQGGVMYQTRENNFSTGKFTLNLSDFAAGVYFVEVTSAKGSTVQKLIVE